jgi:hypothetical protein
MYIKSALLIIIAKNNKNYAFQSRIVEPDKHRQELKDKSSILNLNSQNSVDFESMRYMGTVK